MVLFSTALGIAGVAGTAIDVGLEGARAYQGQESAFDMFIGGSDPESGQLMQKCRETKGKFSDKCPRIDYGSSGKPQDKSQNTPEPQASFNMEKYQNIIALSFILFLIIIVKKV